MKAGRWNVVMNPYDWLPSYGENSISQTSIGLDLTITVEYDGNDGSSQRKVLMFTETSFASRASFPGPKMLDLEHSEKMTPESLGSLVEFPDSEAARVWSDHYGGLRKPRHFRIAFLSENVIFEVVAGNVMLKDIV